MSDATYRAIVHPDGYALAIKVKRSASEEDMSISDKLLLWQADEIERQNARIKDYQDACAQKQEIINGLQEDNEQLQARVKELEVFICETFDWDFSTDEEKEKCRQLMQKHKLGVYAE